MHHIEQRSIILVYDYNHLLPGLFVGALDNALEPLVDVDFVLAFSVNCLVISEFEV